MFSEKEYILENADESINDVHVLLFEVVWLLRMNAVTRASLYLGVGEWEQALGCMRSRHSLLITQWLRPLKGSHGA